MKLGPVTKFDKRNTATLENFDDDVMSVNCDEIFPIFGQFRVGLEARFWTHGL